MKCINVDEEEPYSNVETESEVKSLVPNDPHDDSDQDPTENVDSV